MGKLKCKNKNCGHKWNYKGKKGKAKHTEYTSCPNCKGSVKIIKEDSKC